MVTITLPTTEIKDAMIEGTRVLIQLGEIITYKFFDNSPDEVFKVLRRKLKQDDLVGDFAQGGVKFLIDATTLSKPPEKYDEIVAGNGVTYALIDVNSVDKGADGTIILYKPQAKG